MPSTLTPSCSADRPASAQSPKATPRAKAAVAGTVVTEMKTPTRLLDFADVSASIPAAPATNATGNDHRSGRVMKPVSGRSASRSATDAHPATRISSAATTVSAVAMANPTTSVWVDRRTSRRFRWAMPSAMPASGLNSGPITMPPISSTAESVTIAIAASSDAMVRKVTNVMVRVDSVSAVPITWSHTTASPP
jgi:hypothetical protein